MTEAERTGQGIGGAFSASGRIGPVRAVAGTVVAAILLFVVVPMLGEGEVAAYIVAGALTGVTIAKLFAEWARRLHDLNIAGWWGVAVGVLMLATLFALTVSEAAAAFPWVASAFGTVVVVTLLLPGKRVENRFGPPPAGFAAIGVRRGGVAWAVVATIGGAMIGYTLIDMSNGMRDARERTRQMIEQQEAR